MQTTRVCTTASAIIIIIHPPNVYVLRTGNKVTRNKVTWFTEGVPRAECRLSSTCPCRAVTIYDFCDSPSVVDDVSLSFIHR